jgi:DNA polymerase-3 subunit beta
LPLDYPGDPLEIGFNPQYFVDMLRVVDWAETTIELKDPQSAAVIRERRDDGSYLYLVMPLSLD